MNNLGLLYSNTQRLEQAEKHYQEALDIYRNLTKTNPQIYLPYVASTLNNLGVLYMDTQRLEQVEQHYQEVLNIYRNLAKINPQVYLPDVAITLNNLGLLYSNTQRLKEAEHSYQEALETYTILMKNNSRICLPNIDMTAYIAMGLYNLGVLYRNTQRLKEAEQINQEVLKIFKILAKINPQRYLPYFAITLNNFGSFYLQTKDVGKSEYFLKKALEIRRKLFEENPAAYGDDLARSLTLTALSKKDNPDFCNILKEAFQVAHLKLLKEAIIRDGKTCNLTP